MYNTLNVLQMTYNSTTHYCTTNVKYIIVTISNSILTFYRTIDNTTVVLHIKM